MRPGHHTIMGMDMDMDTILGDFMAVIRTVGTVGTVGTEGTEASTVDGTEIFPWHLNQQKCEFRF